MQDITKIDKNFDVKTKIDKPGIKFYNCLEAPFSIHGIFYEDGKFRRLPESVAKTVSEGVYSLHANTAGGRVRFRTDSPYVAISAKMSNIGKMSHFALCGSAGFDLYVGDRFVKSYIPPFDITSGYEGVIELGAAEMRDITLNFPLYSDVNELFVGLDGNAAVCEPLPYKTPKPIVYYGSSITQGGCASRPGTAYQGHVSRHFDADFINLGFSGNAKGEKEISDYIKGLDMSVFVYDYDHNAPSTEYFAQTHERMFSEIREANPDLPIILMSRPNYPVGEVGKERLKIIKRTHENAVSSGDKNVYLIDGQELMRLAGNEGTVDMTHPTDLGFFSMAQALIAVLEKII